MPADLTRVLETPVNSTFNVRPLQRPGLRILVTSAGRRVELLRCFRAAAVDLGADLELLACDLQPSLSSACQHADLAFAVPRVDDPGYSDAILEICIRQGVSLVIPTIDTELLPFSLARGAFDAQGINIVVSHHRLVESARDKLAKAEFKAENGIA